jgi:hypothetical protein
MPMVAMAVPIPTDLLVIACLPLPTLRPVDVACPSLSGE